MPKKVHTDDWVKAARQMIRAEMAADAKWYISNRNGSVQLEVRDGGKYQSRVLNYEWSKKGLFEASRRIIVIYKNFYSDTGRGSLAKSCEVSEAISSKGNIDYDQLFEDFRKNCPSASDNTFKKSYMPVLDAAKKLLTSKKKPIDGEDLMLKALEQWEYGSRSRQIARRAIQKFLEYAVLRGKLSNNYAPVKIQETLKQKRVGYALEDEQVLQLIASEKNPSWQFAYQLMSVYGLRPEELRHLVVKKGVHGKELWCLYRKSMGGTKGQKTEPRQLAPLHIKDGKGYINWNLLDRIDKKEELPSLGKVASGGLRKHLERSNNWKKFKQDAIDLGEEIVPYSFRHRFAKEAHSRSVELGLTLKDIAFVMGHTVEVHQQNYARFIPKDTFTKFAKQLVNQ